MLFYHIISYICFTTYNLFKGNNEKAEVYSSTNWPLFTGGQNSIVNWVLKTQSFKPKIKK